MNIDVGVYYKYIPMNSQPLRKTVNLNQGELEEIITDYIEKEYLKDWEEVISIHIESVNGTS